VVDAAGTLLEKGEESPVDDAQAIVVTKGLYKGICICVQRVMQLMDGW
jgi:hypothetical protein